jgi:hypothetical protein
MENMKSKNYRIVEFQTNGKKDHFKVECRFFWIFWYYLGSETANIYTTKKAAQDDIDEQIRRDTAKKTKIIHKY